jgi:Uma2 family endonuclease
MPVPTSSEPLSVPVPQLEAGDHLTRDEFERRYEAMPHLKKAELIEGVVHMPSPVRWDRHGRPHVSLIVCLGTYAAHTPGVQSGDNATVRLDAKNEPQPDVMLMIDPAHGGQAKISSDDYMVGAPELVAEIASSSVSIDLNTKFRIYQRNGVKEYIVWRVLDEAIDWFVLGEDGKFERLPLDLDGCYRSRVFHGLWLEPSALIRDDLKAVLQVLEKGLASPEHAAFLARLKG